MMRSPKMAGMLRAALAVSLCSGVAATDAAAATGALLQKPGAAGCIVNLGAAPCASATALDGAFAVTVSPDGASAYVASFVSDAVVVFDRAADGTLTQKSGGAGCVSDDGSGGACSDGRALDGAFSVTVSPDGASVYVAAQFGGVAVFDRVADGTLTQKPGIAGCVSLFGTGSCTAATELGGAVSVTVSSDGRSAYVASSFGVAVFDRAADGTLTQKPGTAACVSEDGSGGACADGTALSGAASVSVSPDRKSVYVASLVSDAVAVFDRSADGTLTQKPGAAGCISQTGAGPCADGTALAGAIEVTVSSDNESVYVASQSSDALAVFDRAADGTLTQKPGTAGCVSESGTNGACSDGTSLSRVNSVTVSPDAKSVYAASRAGGGVTVFDREADGRLTQKAGTEGCLSEDGSAGACVDARALQGAESVTVSPDAKSVYVASQYSASVAVFDRETAASAPPPPAPQQSQLPQQPQHPPLRPTPSRTPDTTRPLLGPLSLSPSRFRAAANEPSIVARRGSTVSFTLSEAAIVTFRVEHAVAGRRVGGRCVTPKRSNRRARRCTRYRNLHLGFNLPGQMGRNTFTFSGRVRNRTLEPGSYRLRAAATDGALNASRPNYGLFRIVGRQR